jgi:hypothetical protein
MLKGLQGYGVGARRLARPACAERREDVLDSLPRCVAWYQRLEFTGAFRPRLEILLTSTKFTPACLQYLLFSVRRPRIESSPDFPGQT